jgi:flagellar biosynthesis protein FlhB
VNDSGERTEAATPKRLAKARAQGRWGQSPATAACLAIALAALPVMAAGSAAASWIALWRASARAAISVRDAPLTNGSVQSAWLWWRDGWLIVGSAWIAACVAAVTAAAASGALGFAPGALQPRLERLAWRSGASQLLSAEGVIAATMAAAGVAIVMCCAWPALRGTVEFATAGLLTGAAIAILCATFVHAWSWLVPGLGVLAFFDAWHARKRAAHALRMSPREVRDERADNEGRPELRAHRRASATRFSRSVSVGAIRAATAVIANPTHVAVALRYAPPRIDVPIIVSRGADLAATLVRTIAALHDVPIIESPELARMLFASASLGEPIPEQCYAAVASIFAMLLQTRGSLGGSDDR